MQTLTSELIRTQLPAKENGSKPERSLPGDVLRLGADALRHRGAADPDLERLSTLITARLGAA